MGISDEDYADALAHQRLHEVALMKLELEKQREEAKMSISGATGLGNLIGSMGGAGGQAQNQGAGMNPYQQQQLVYNSATTQAVPLTGTISNATNATWLAQQGIHGVKIINEKDLKHDAMQAPLSALVDMWQMRWQGEWVSETEFQEDEFWRLALIRLTGANKLEKHHLASSYYAVYRIIE